jgi:hypothetical protein
MSNVRLSKLLGQAGLHVSVPDQDELRWVIQVDDRQSVITPRRQSVGVTRPIYGPAYLATTFSRMSPIKVKIRCTLISSFSARNQHPCCLERKGRAHQLVKHIDRPSLAEPCLRCACG